MLERMNNPADPKFLKTHGSTGKAATILATLLRRATPPEPVGIQLNALAKQHLSFRHMVDHIVSCA